MDNYKINTNREKLSEQEIQQNMNFDKFMTGYAAKAGWLAKGAKFYSLLGGSAAIVAVVSYFVYQGVTAVSPAGNTSGLPFIAPPIAKTDAEFTVFSPGGNKDTTFVYEDGSKIHVPASAFLDENGKPVTEGVELRYREFHDPAAFFLSGIPMTYDSAGQQFHFESAGMMEMAAFKGGKPLFVNPAAMIQVDLISHTDDDRFNIYYLDTTKRKWEYIAEDHATKCKVESEDKRLAKGAAIEDEKFGSLAQQLKVPEMPALPAKANPANAQFIIDYKKDEFPELAVYDGLKFEISNTDVNFKPSYSTKTWEDVVIKKSGESDKYEVTFSSETESHTFSVTPVIDGVGYKKALEIYSSRMKEYNSTLKARLEKQKREQQKADSIFTAKGKMTEDYNMNARYTAFLNKNLVQYDALAYRAFQIAKFGVWNSDCPSSLPTGASVYARFVDKNKHALSFDKIYLVAKGKNAVYTYYSFGKDLKDFKFNPKDENMIWAATRENKMALLSVDEFDKTNMKKDTVLFKMKIIDQPIKRAAQLRTLLNI